MSFCRGDGRCEICDPPIRQDPDETEDEPPKSAETSGIIGTIEGIRTAHEETGISTWASP